MPDEPKVCQRCGAPMEIRADWVAPMCPQCAEEADFKPPARKGSSLWWLLVWLLGPGMLNLFLAARRLEGVAVFVAFLGAVVGGLAAAAMLARRIQGPLLVRVLGGLVVGVAFAAAGFVAAFFGCAIGSDFHSGRPTGW